jgi:hypothetical protein
MVKSNSFSATHPDLSELKNKLVEDGMAFKVASTDVAWKHRTGESGKPTRNWAACFSNPTRQTNFWDMPWCWLTTTANIVVEKRDLSKIGGRKRGGSIRGSRERPKVTRQQGRAHPTHGLPLNFELNPGSGCGHAGCRSSGSSPDTDGGALYVGGGGQGRQALEDVQSTELRTLVLSV